MKLGIVYTSTTPELIECVNEEIKKNLGDAPEILNYQDPSILAEVREVCDYIMIISKGKLVASDTPENLERYLGESGLIEIETRTEASKVKEVLKNVPGIEKVSVKTDASGITSGQIREKRGQDIREELFTTFAEKKMPLLKLNAVQVSLEDVFMELTQSDKAAEEFARKAKEAEKEEVSNAGDL